MAKADTPRKNNKKNARTRQVKAIEEPGLMKSLMGKLKRHAALRFLCALLSALLLLLLDLLISWNRLDVFLLLTGTEILLAAGFGWFFYFYRRRTELRASASENED